MIELAASYLFHILLLRLRRAAITRLRHMSWGVLCTSRTPPTITGSRTRFHEFSAFFWSHSTLLHLRL